MFHILGNKFKCCETTSAISLLTLTCVELGEENQFRVFSWSNYTTYLLSFHPNTVCPQWLSRLLSSFCTVYSDLKISVAQHMTSEMRNLCFDTQAVLFELEETKYVGFATEQTFWC